MVLLVSSGGGSSRSCCYRSSGSSSSGGSSGGSGSSSGSGGSGSGGGSLDGGGGSSSSCGSSISSYGGSSSGCVYSGRSGGCGSRNCSGEESSRGSSDDHPIFHVCIRYYGKLLKYVKITLVEAGNAVLAVFDEALQNEAMRKLTGIHHVYTYFLSYTQSFISVITESLGKRCTWDDRWLWYCCRRNLPNCGIHWISHWISLVQELADTLASAANTYRH